MNTVTAKSTNTINRITSVVRLYSLQAKSFLPLLISAPKTLCTLFALCTLLTRTLALSCLLLLSAFPVTLQAQSKAELSTLFFDAVYLEDPEEILLSSAGRNNSGLNIPDSAAEISSPDIFNIENLLENIATYETSINAFISNGGAFDPNLAQEYLAVSALYEQAGDFEKAVQALENNMHIERVNQGLYTLAQTQAVQKLIDTNKAQKNYAEADKYHEYLYYLMSRNHAPDSEEFIATELEWASWNMEAFRRLVFSQDTGLTAGNGLSSVGASMLRRNELVAFEDSRFSQIIFVPRNTLSLIPTSVTGSSNYFDQIRINSFSADQLVDPRLKKAEDIFDKIPEISPRHDESILQKAHITFLFKTQLDKTLTNNRLGSRISTQLKSKLEKIPYLRRAYASSRTDLLSRAVTAEESSPLEAAQAYLDLADWNLAFDRRQRASQGYEKAYEILSANGYSDNEIATFITPEEAQFIPQFASYEFTRRFQNIPENLDIAYKGYIDVTFDKRKDGTLQRINIVNSSENTGQPIRARLLSVLRSAIVRPLFLEGELQAQSDIKVRYYYSY